jgi:hypothetical protein
MNISNYSEVMKSAAVQTRKAPAFIEYKTGICTDADQYRIGRSVRLVRRVAFVGGAFIYSVCAGNCIWMNGDTLAQASQYFDKITA